MVIAQYEFMTGTTANAVNVGLTATPIITGMDQEWIDLFTKEFHPLQSITRFGQPEDVGDVVGLLCSNDARWITGSVVTATGGSYGAL